MQDVPLMMMHSRTLQDNWPVTLTGDTGRFIGLPPYDHIWIVAIRRSKPDVNGIVRWFPQIEVRTPAKFIRTVGSTRQRFYSANAGDEPDESARA